MLHVPYHADDLDRSHHHQADLPADRVLTGKDAPCQEVIDHHHRGETRESRSVKNRPRRKGICITLGNRG